MRAMRTPTIPKRARRPMTMPALALCLASLAASGCETDDGGEPAAPDVETIDGAIVTPDTDPADFSGIRINDAYVPPPDMASPPDMARPDMAPTPDPEPQGLPDLLLLQDELAGDIWLDERYFAEDDCAFVEGCIDTPGTRLLLRFGVVTANVGDVDLRMGEPEDNLELFEYSDCHEHYHFERYADYQLMSGPDVVSIGRKQAFCLMDSARYLEDDPTVNRRAQYQCGYQGISRGWQDTYHSRLDCQWIDVTDLMPGQYDLAVQINPDRIIPEKSFDNNDAVARVTVPPYDIGQDCPAEGTRGDFRRACGWEVREVGECQQGHVVEIGCGGCGFGRMCDGDPMMRICEGNMTQCLPSSAIAQRDNGCEEGNLCPHVEFACPESGVFTIWTAGKELGEPFGCPYEVRSGPPRLEEECQNDERGLDRNCGWTRAVDLQGEPVSGECNPGFEYRVGCNPEGEGCEIGTLCEGDTIMRVCPSEEPCLSASALAFNDDSCDTYCSTTRFECPANGRYSVWVGAYRSNRDARCVPSIERVVE